MWCIIALLCFFREGGYRHFVILFFHEFHWSIVFAVYSTGCCNGCAWSSRRFNGGKLGIIDRASSLKGWFSQAKESESNPFSDAQSYDYGVMKITNRMGSRISILLMISLLVILRMLYKKLNYARIWIDSYLWSNGGQTQRWRHHWQLFRVFIISTNRFCVVVGLYSNRSQKTWKCGCASCASFWRYLWSIGKQTHGNMESLFCRIYYHDRDAFFFIFNQKEILGNEIE